MMYASKVFQSIRLSTSRLSTAVCSALTWRRVCMMGWTVGKPKLEPWPGRKLCCQAGFEFFDHTGSISLRPDTRRKAACQRSNVVVGLGYLLILPPRITGQSVHRTIPARGLHHHL